MPAWGETLGKRLSAHPKVHIIDSGLAGWLLGLSVAKINSRNPAALTEFGHLVETFAVGEILKQVSWAEELITASHFRTEAGDEVDLVLETWDGRVAGFEIKAGTRIKDPDLSGLRLLRDRLGDRFVGGFILNLGELPTARKPKIAGLPLSALWSLPAGLAPLVRWRHHPSSANHMMRIQSSLTATSSSAHAIMITPSVLAPGSRGVRQLPMAPPNQGESPCRLADSRGGALPPVLASGFAALIAEYERCCLRLLHRDGNA